MFLVLKLNWDKSPALSYSCPLDKYSPPYATCQEYKMKKIQSSPPWGSWPSDVKKREHIIAGVNTLGMFHIAI